MRRPFLFGNRVDSQPVNFPRATLGGMKQRKITTRFRPKMRLGHHRLRKLLIATALLASLLAPSGLPTGFGETCFDALTL